MVFSKLDFERDGKMLVIAEGKKYKNGVEACDDPKFCTTIKVPAEGAIMILEKSDVAAVLQIFRPTQQKKLTNSSKDPKP